MPSFFVWSTPSLVVVIDAASEKAAAEAFLELPVTDIPKPGIAPDCFVEPAINPGASPPGAAVEQFWIAINGEPINNFPRGR